MDTTENNRIVAEFMGWKERTDPTERWLGQWKDKKFQLHKILFFDTDWNWLMEVVEKINVIDDYRYTVQINSMDTYIHDLKNGGFIFQSDMKWQPNELINSVYEAVVEFIKWYNQQNK